MREVSHDFTSLVLQNFSSYHEIKKNMMIHAEVETYHISKLLLGQPTVFSCTSTHTSPLIPSTHHNGKRLPYNFGRRTHRRSHWHGDKIARCCIQYFDLYFASSTARYCVCLSHSGSLLRVSSLLYIFQTRVDTLRNFPSCFCISSLAQEPHSMPSASVTG